jgi:hypothetical protein
MPQKDQFFPPIRIKWPLNFPLPKKNKVAPPYSFHRLEKKNLFFTHQMAIQFSTQEKEN